MGLKQVLSPLSLMQEEAPKGKHYPWRVLVCCTLLNLTQGVQARPIVGRIWKLFPQPKAMADMQPDAKQQLAELLRPLGLYNRRIVTLQRMSADYVAGKPYAKCYGVGQFALDSIALFVDGRTDLEPTDTWLKPYLDWRLSGGPPVEWRPLRG